MANFYCKNCGRRFGSVFDLTSRPCTRHPNGTNKGPHELYEGEEKERYTCKYCGRTFNSIYDMTERPCSRHPNGANKGNHSPAL